MDENGSAILIGANCMTLYDIVDYAKHAKHCEST